MTWQQLNHGLFTALLFQQIGMSFVLGLIILIAACTVIATLIMVVMEKKKEIALLKAIGATQRRHPAHLPLPGRASSAWRARSSASPSAGSCCKFLIAYAFPLDPKVYFISKLPVSMHPSEFVLPALIALAICLDATVLPALHAAEMRPADGLRDEPADDLTSWRIAGGADQAAWDSFARQWWQLCAAQVYRDRSGAWAIAYAWIRGAALLVARMMRPAPTGTVATAAARDRRRDGAWLIYTFTRVGLIRCMVRGSSGAEPCASAGVVGGADRFLPLMAVSVLRALIVVTAALICLILPGILAAPRSVASPNSSWWTGECPRLQPCRASWEATVGKKGRLTLFRLADRLLPAAAGGLLAGWRRGRRRRR